MAEMVEIKLTGNPGITDEELAELEKVLGTAAKSPLDSQVGGNHYKEMGEFQPWNVLAHWLTPEELRGYMKGTVIAYLARERAKGSDTDIEKSMHTMELWQHVRKDGPKASE